MRDSLLPPSGRLIEGAHHYPVRVYYEDTDAGGVVYYANYLKFAERARTEALRCLGIEQKRLREESGLLFVVTHVEASYRKPAWLDDELIVQTHLRKLGQARMTMEQIIFRKEMALVGLCVEIACIRAEEAEGNFRPARLPEALRHTLEQAFRPPSEA
jgi:acyl-CoA thioester hydrolase